jgi:pimeloyl-ACP methyl ester carboxylesterase
MNLFSIFTFVFVVVLGVGAHADPKEWLLQSKQLQELSAKNKWLGKKDASVAGIFQQSLDHINKKDTRTFEQRHWVNSSYASGLSAPVLLYICGEGACGSWALGGALAQHAEKLGAHMVALEHRYYGQSQPFADLRTENLKYLTIEQSLADLIAYKKAIQSQNKWTGKWIAVGGSYAGSMAAYLRAQYPQEIAGALASSGPVLPDVDFSEYDRHVAEQAGTNCLQATQRAVTDIEEYLKTPAGFENIKTQFQAEVLRDQGDFLYLVADTTAAAVQYGMKDRYCEKVETRGLTGYAEAAKMVAGIFGNLVELSAQAAESTALATGPIGMRQWFYQSCTEFGFFQNAWHDPEQSARSVRINAQYHEQVCQRLFGLPLPDVTEVTKKYYEPLLTPTVSNIFFTNGSQDPWLKLSIAPQNNNNVNPQTPVYVLQGEAHCDDLGRGVSEAITIAREMFVTLAQNWLLAD